MYGHISKDTSHHNLQIILCPALLANVVIGSISKDIYYPNKCALHTGGFTL